MRNFLKIYKYIIMFHFLWGIISICGALVMIKIEMVVIHSIHCNNIIFLMNIFFLSECLDRWYGRYNYTGVCYLWISLDRYYCVYLGERVTFASTKVYDGIFWINWYTFPVDLQRITLNIMAVAQQSVQLKGLMQFSCTRDTFKNVSSIMWLI